MGCATPVLTRIAITLASEVFRVRMSVNTAQAFAKRTREIVYAGRPISVICGQPIDADGAPAPSSRTDAGARSGDWSTNQ